MNLYEKALSDLEKAKKKLSYAYEKESMAAKAVEEARSKLSIECGCGTVTPVRDIPFLEECMPDYGPWEDDYGRTYRTSWICPGCGDEWKDFKSTEFPEGIKKYCKEVHKWERWEPDEVKKLRERSREKLRKEFNEKEHKRKIEHAKKLLKKEGII